MATWHPVAGAPLTEKDRWILFQLSQGYSLKQIAHMAGRSEITIRQRLVGIRTKLDARTTIEAVTKAIWSGEIGRNWSCGTTAAVRRHIRKRETCDPRCLMKKALNARRYRADHGSGRGNERKHDE